LKAKGQFSLDFRWGQEQEAYRLGDQDLQGSDDGDPHDLWKGSTEALLIGDETRVAGLFAKPDSSTTKEDDAVGLDGIWERPVRVFSDVQRRWEEEGNVHLGKQEEGQDCSEAGESDEEVLFQNEGLLISLHAHEPNCTDNMTQT
jgi:hypothetical protein